MNKSTPTPFKPGTIVTIAGNGEPGYSGDGGPAVRAMLNEPKSITLAGSFLYIADSENHRIRRVDLRNGTIETVAGGGGRPSSQDRAVLRKSIELEEDPLADPVFRKEEKYTQLADQSGTVRFVTGAVEKGRFGGDGGPALDATLNFPSATAIDAAGDLYIADTFNHRIRRVDAVSRCISTVAGTGAARFTGDGNAAEKAALNEPVALALDETAGRLYIADLANYRVRVVFLDTGRIDTYAGNGKGEYDGDGHPGTEAALSGPSGLALDTAGNLYVADTFSGRIRVVEAMSGIIRTVAGDGGEYRYQAGPGEFSTSLSRPSGIAVSAAGKLYVTDSDNHLIRLWNPRTKIITSIAGNGSAGFAGDGGPAERCSLNYPFGIAVDADGNIFIADTFSHRIRMIASSQEAISPST
jgi:DNA-binding beta-propeller fold protein YncE